MQVTMKQNRFNAGGALMAAGSTQDLPDDFALDLVRQGAAAYVTAPAATDFRPDNNTPAVSLVSPGTALVSGATTDALNGAEGLNGNGAAMVIHANAVARFGFGGYGSVSFSGGAIPAGGTVAVVDARGTVAANPIWSVMQTGANSYIIGGTKTS